MNPVSCQEYIAEPEAAIVLKSSVSEKPEPQSPLTYDGSTIGPRKAHPGRLYELTSTVDSHPKGYPRQAAFADSDECFMIYRRFGFVHARLLLRRQDELRELEDKLIDLDIRDSKNFNRERCLKCREEDDDNPDSNNPWRESRGSILDKMEDKTLKYGVFLIEFVSRPGRV
ncbi:MAG: hypothetical protein LQ342_008092 [Letrouitia transgressa]|nr:MAG: hypothetical protein LQ342_008092 [Letrouitia transgressa]